MRSSWTFSRKLALGFAVIVVAFVIVAVTGLQPTQSLAARTHEVRAQLSKLLAALVEPTRETEAGAPQTLQTSSQPTSL